jgi:tetratricopeptide (TPR) repeat protein
MRRSILALSSPAHAVQILAIQILAILTLVAVPCSIGPASAQDAQVAPQKPVEGAASAEAGKPVPRATALDTLYDRLSKAKSGDEAKGIAGAIERVQLRSGSDTADLLMSRALTAIQAGKSEVAVDLLTAIVKIDPDFTEAWNKRATLYFLKNDYAHSVADIAETLKREPRHFGAWAGLGMILRETGDKKRAYEAFKKALAVNPYMDTIKKAVDDLREDVEGRDI